MHSEIFRHDALAALLAPYSAPMKPRVRSPQCVVRNHNQSAMVQTNARQYSVCVATSCFCKIQDFVHSNSDTNACLFRDWIPSLDHNSDAHTQKGTHIPKQQICHQLCHQITQSPLCTSLLPKMLPLFRRTVQIFVIGFETAKRFLFVCVMRV